MKLRTVLYSTFLILFAGCYKSDYCLELYSFKIPVLNNLDGQAVAPGDSIFLTLDFPQMLRDERKQALFDISDANVNLLLVLRAYTLNNNSFSNYPAAKQDFEIEVLEGAAIVETDTVANFLNPQFLSPEEVVLLVPARDAVKNTLRIKIKPQKRGQYFMYWQYSNFKNNYKDLIAEEGRECSDVVHFTFRNSGITNLEVAGNNSHFNSSTTQDDLINARAIAFIDVR